MRSERSFALLMISVVLSLLLFGLDLIIPRGPAPAIGYCGVMVLASQSRHTHKVLALGSACSALALLGYVLEPDGTPAWMSFLNRILVIGVIWLTTILALLRQRDLSSLERKTEQLAVTNHSLEQFSAIVAHDLRSPLMSIDGSTQMLLESSGKLDEDELTLLRSIDESARRMGKLIGDLLERARARHAPLTMQPINTRHLVEEVIHNLRTRLAESGGHVTLSSLPVVNADSSMLAQVFQNLIENAIKYRSNQPPQISISCTYTKTRGWIFAIQDNGIGIGPEMSGKLFNMYERGETAWRTEGAGIGLSICETIVKRHGGEIWVKSELGAGSTFFFSLPSQPGYLQKGKSQKHTGNSTEWYGQGKDRGLRFERPIYYWAKRILPRVTGE